MTRVWAFVLTVALVAGALRPAAAMTVLPLDLPALTTQAGTIFVGRVERSTAGVDERGTAAVWTTFTVEQMVKGPGADHLTVKQFDGRLGGGLPTLSRFAPGESVVLFVYAPSVLGFASPVGFGQGCFRIRERDGTRVVENDVANRNLGRDAATAAGAPTGTVPAPLPLDTLLARVRALLAAAP